MEQAISEREIVGFTMLRETANEKTGLNSDKDFIIFFLYKKLRKVFPP